MNIQPLEPIEVINKRLLDHYGRFENGEANFRIVWSDDQLEKRLMDYTDEGFHLITPIVREVPKYNYIKSRYVLERLVPVPEYNYELTTKISYEPLWTFEDIDHNPIPPTFIGSKILIDCLIEQMLAAGHKAPIKQDEKDGNTVEAIEHRVDVLQEQLFGNETSIGDALKNDSAVGYGVRKRSDWLN